MSTRVFGKAGEEYAENLLLERGYKILLTNFRCKFGEIDIIAIDQEALVFVEVKTRWSKKYGLPEEAVNKKKLERIRRTGEHFCLLNQSKRLPTKMRIDVVAIEIENGKVRDTRVINVD